MQGGDVVAPPGQVTGAPASRTARQPGTRRLPVVRPHPCCPRQGVGRGSRPEGAACPAQLHRFGVVLGAPSPYREGMKTPGRIISSPLGSPSSDPRARDRALVERIGRRETAALREAMSAHAGAVHRMARAIVSDAGAVEEVAQDVFLALWDRPERFDAARAGLGTYLVAMARNKAIDRLRSYHARERAADSLVEATRSSGRGTSAEHDVDLRSSLVPLIAALPATHREAIVLAFYLGRTYKQVAQELEIPEGTAKTRIRQGLRSMRLALQNADSLGAPA